MWKDLLPAFGIGILMPFLLSGCGAPAERNDAAPVVFEEMAREAERTGDEESRLDPEADPEISGDVTAASEPVENAESPASEDAEPEGSAELEESSESGESPEPAETSEQPFEFVDVFGEWHTTTINPAAPKTEYDPACFTRNADGRVRYESASHVSRMGIDLAKHQGSVDWQAVREDGVEFAFIRLGYRGYGQAGNIKLDERFEENAAGAHKAGIQFGVYFFSQAVNEAEAEEEAAFVIEHLRGLPIDLEVVFDAENILDEPARTDDVTGEQFTKNALRFCAMIEEAGYRPMVYSNMMWQAYQYDMQSLSRYPVWYADYEELPQTPYRFKYWQYSESGRVRGVGSTVDLDIEFMENS